MRQMVTPDFVKSYPHFLVNFELLGVGATIISCLFLSRTGAYFANTCMVLRDATSSQSGSLKPEDGRKDSARCGGVHRGAHCAVMPYFTTTSI